MQKRGQLSLFFIIGLIILIVVLLFAIYKTNFISSVQGVKISREGFKIKNYIEACIKETANDALLQISNGGYSNIKLSTNLNGRKIAYWYYKGNDYSLNENEISSDISSFINNFLPYCVKGEIEGYKIEKNEPVTWIELNENNIEVKVYWIVEIKKGAKIEKLNDFKIILPIKLKKIIEISRSIVNSFVLNPNNICLSCGCEEIEINNQYAVKCTDSGNCEGCLDSLASLNDLKIHLILNKIENPNDEIVIILEDINSKVDGENYKFVFANRF